MTSGPDRKQSDSLLSAWEHSVVTRLVPWIPGWLQSHHLTMLTLAWSGIVVLAGIRARAASGWLAVMSGAIALQYVTDALDGKIGKLRDSGLVKWGYYMDHLLDYVFLSAILIAYTMLLPARFQYLMVPVMAISGAFMVSSFLARAVTGTLTISYLRVGPFEMRLVFIGINTWLATFGKGYMVAAIPYVIGLALVVLTMLVADTQRRLWRLDREGPRLRTEVQPQASHLPVTARVAPELRAP